MLFGNFALKTRDLRLIFAKNILFLLPLRYSAILHKNSYILIILSVLLLGSCGTKKNTFVHRGYHNLTARFNGYYWSSEAIKEGVYKIEAANKDNYERVLPVFVVPSNESAKATFPDFDKAIKKSSLVIQRHTIKDKKDNEIPTAGKWIDNNWINIGISRYYKREFFSGIESFDYVVRTYKTKDKYKAMLWAAKAYNEIGAVSQSDPIIGLLNNDKNTPKKIKSELYAVRGDYYIKRGLNKEAIQVLTEASNQKSLLGKGIKKKYRARYAYIAAQLYEEQKDNKKARNYYTKTISLKPQYDMVFYANIKLARLAEIKNGNSDKVKSKLLKMTKDVKNSEYLDVIYFTLGEIEEKEKQPDKAIVYYKKSARSSVSNNNQKSAAYLKLGEIYFEKPNFSISEAYYDSTIAVLPKDHPNYNNILNRKTTLSSLVGYIRTIQREDSLQKLAKMQESERNKIIDAFIAKLTEQEEKKQEELEYLKSQNLNPISGGTNTVSSGGGEIASSEGNNGAWYFYNPTTLSFGVSDFAKKWGNRKLEDNWRRSQKGITIDNQFDNEPVVNTNDPKLGGSKPKIKDPRKTREYYLRQLPLNDSLMAISHKRIVENDYLLGTTYKEDLNINRKAISAFEDLNNRYPEHKYRLSCYYQLYRLYLAEKNQSQSDFYKQKLLNEYPESEYAKLIKNPKYAEERNAQRSEVEKFYESTYESYSKAEFSVALAQCNEANTKFGKTDFTPKFEFIRSLSIGKTTGIDSMESALNQLVILYPKSEVIPKANAILLAIKKQKSPEMFSEKDSVNPMSKDTFLINLESEHYVLVISPDDPKIANPMKLAIDEFDQKFYSNKNFSISSNLFATANQMILLKSFETGREAYSYLENLKNEPSVYKNGIKKEIFSFFIISKENLPVFYKKASVSSYKAFYDAAYKTVADQINK